MIVFWMIVSIWPVIGWLRMFLAYRDFKRSNRGFEIEFDWAFPVKAAIWPWFDR